MTIRPRNLAFTIIELLVVISIITLLIALVTPSLSRARHEAKVTRCLSNYHQWGNAVLAYAGDWVDALPRQDMPQTTGVNTWDVSNEFPIQMGNYGLDKVEMWDCPVREELARHKSFDDLRARFSSAYGFFSIIHHNWWVPRRFGHAYFPSREFDPAADIDDHWPTSVSDPRGEIGRASCRERV